MYPYFGDNETGHKRLGTGSSPSNMASGYGRFGSGNMFAKPVVTWLDQRMSNTRITPKKSGSLIWICMVAAAFSLGACKTATVTQTPYTNNGHALKRVSSIYVVTPLDGSYDGTKYIGSGAEVARAFSTAFLKNGSDVVIGNFCESTLTAVEAAKSKGCAFVVIPTITRWEDRATEWSGIRDKMELFVKIVSVSDGSVVSSAEIKGKSRWATLGGDHPTDLLVKPVSEWVAGLY